MADTQFEGIEGGYAPVGAEGRLQHMVNLAGAACSVALIVGLGVWGYKLAVRDVAGVPVIRAIEGPLRVAPENPGGEIAVHQGLSVNAVAEAGAAAPLPDELILAPRPIELSLDDAPGLSSPPGEAVLMEQHDTDLAAPVALAAEAAPDAIELALAEALGAEAFAEATEEVAAREALAAVRPMPRPSALSAAGISAIEPTSAPVLAEIDPATLAPGTRLVQLGAFDEAEAARAEWARLQQRFADLMAGKALVVQPATAGGRTFFRLRAHGFEDEDDARRFCAAVLGETSACIPVAQR